MPAIYTCPKCNGPKDRRAKHCRKCMEQPRPREGLARFHAKTGYNYLMISGSPVWEHRYIMEQHIGRKLSRKEHVHHKNGIKTDNRLDNLEIMDASEHHRSHWPSDVAKQLSALGLKARWGDRNSNV